MAFEKNLYHIWFQGCENISDKQYLFNIEQWQNLNPDWNYKCLDNNDLLEMCREYSPMCSRAYTKTTNMHTKIDLGRLVSLYLHGGMSIDMDMYALRPLSFSKQLTDLTLDSSKQHVLGLSVLPLNWIEKIFIHQSEANVYNNAMIATNKGNPVLKDIINDYIDRILNMFETGGGHVYVLKITGPILFNSNVYKFLENHKDSVSLYEFDNQVFEANDSTKYTISIHNFEMSWMSDNYRFIAKYYLANKLFFYLMIIILLYILLKKLF